MSEGPGGPQGATAGGTLAMRMLSQQAMVASQMKRAANDKAIAQMLAAKKSGPPAARLGDEIQHKSFLGALAGAVLGAIVTIAEGCLIMAACATGPYALVLVPALMYASYKASDYVEEKQNQLESWINSFCDTDGAINTGSENVNINGKPAARAAVTLPPPPPPGAIPEIPQGEPSWGDIATDLLESAAEKAEPLAKAWGNAVITLTESNAGFMDLVSAGASLLFPAGPVLMEFATMVGGRGEIKKDVDFPEAGEDTALCDKENKPPRIAQGSSNVFINNQPAARKGDKLECSAAIVEGSPDVFIGGEQVTYLDIQPEFPPWQRMILGGITIASYLLPPAGLLGKLGNLAKLGKLGNLLGKSGKLLGAKLGALLGKTGKSLKSIANKVIRWVTDPVDPVTGAYCDERTGFTLGQTLPLSFTRFHSSVLPLHGLTGVGWSDSWSEYAWVREQGNRVDIISLGATLNFAFDGESDTAVNPYHAQYILRRRDDYLELFDRDALSSRFFYDAFPGMRLRHPMTDDTSDDRLAHSPADRMAALTRKVGRKVRYVIVLRGQIVTGLRHWYARRRGHDPRAMLYNAVQHQWLTEQQTGEIWRQYVPHQFLFAEILTTLGHINRSAINVLLLRHERSSLPLGKFLVTEGVISQETLDRVLTIQRELQVSMQSLLLKAGLNTEQVAQLESENEGE